jgi:hypothetical protein
VHHETWWCNVFNATKESCFRGNTTKQYSSLAHQYDVHILGGHIVPLQNASALNISNSVDLSNYRTDLHIHPACTFSAPVGHPTGCNATGKFTDN